MRIIKTFTAAALTVLLLGGCSQNHSNTAEVATATTAPKVFNDIKAAGAGPVTKENTTLAGIHIGDSQEQVKQMFGEPTEVMDGGGGTPNLQWYYEKESMYISFYRLGENEPAGGVVDILINEPSSQKTEKNIGIGSSDKDILQAYPLVVQSKASSDHIVNYWLTGTIQEEGFYIPALTFIVKEGKITNIELSNFLIDPSK